MTKKMIYAFAFQETTFPIDILTSSPANKVSNLQTDQISCQFSFFKAGAFLQFPFNSKTELLTPAEKGSSRLLKGVGNLN